MAKFLIKGSYSVEGTKGLLREGGSSRKAALEKMIEGLGGKLESFYYAVGDADAYVVIDTPDLATATAASLAVNSSGAVQMTTTPLMTVEELDAACKKTVDYRAPGA